MEQLWHFLDGCPSQGTIFTPEGLLLSLLLAFVLGQALAWVHYGTHNELSYSRLFVQSLILITVVASMAMAVIGSNIITAFWLMGALAIIRFRNMIMDTRDVAFTFCALAIGMASGSQRYAIAVVGTVVLCLIAVYMYLVSFGSRRPRKAFLRFDLVVPMESEHTLPAVLRRFCNSFSLISVQDNTCVTHLKVTSFVKLPECIGGAAPRPAGWQQLWTMAQRGSRIHASRPFRPHTSGSVRLGS